MHPFPAVTPFLKWAGSKRRLLDQIREYVPSDYGKYFEPFLGGGSLFFALSPKAAEISDVSEALIATYKSVKKDPHSIHQFIRPLTPTRDDFNHVKSSSYRRPSSKAGAFIFLNKTCWNGLYRVNSEGQFNVPFGQPRSDNIIDLATLTQCSKALRRRGVSIKCQDFGAIELRTKKGDFVFLDPPYVTSHNMNGFVDWNEKLFSWRDQLRLAALAKRLVRRGVNVLVTNADHESIYPLFKDFGKSKLNRFSTLASDREKRRPTTEAIFYAGPNY